MTQRFDIFRGKRPLALLAGILLLGGTMAVAGCSRTDDGTILLNRPSTSLGLGSMSQRWRARRASQQAQATNFPPPPAARTVRSVPVDNRPTLLRPVRPSRSASNNPAVPLSEFRAPRVGVKAPFAASNGPAKAMACTNESKPGERVKMTCQ